MRFLFTIAMTLLLYGCYKNESVITDTLIYCSEAYPQSFNSQISHDISTLDATTHQLYNRLVKFDASGESFIPDLATHWQQSDDKLSFTFFLRKNVNFQHTDYFTPTRFFNADDVIFSFQRMLEINTPYNSINRAGDSYFYNHPFTNLVADVIKIDDYTVKFILNEPDVTLLANLAAHYGVIISKQYGEKLLSIGHPEKIDYYPIGTGPYQFKNANKRTGIIRYNAHPQYWGVRPSIKNLIFEVTTNKTKRHSKLLSGECDIITYPEPSQLDKMAANPKIKLHRTATDNLALWSFNTVAAQFNNKNIRQAFSYAIDQKTIIEAIFFQSGNATSSLLAEQSWAYNPKRITLQYNPQLALEMLKNNNFDFNKTITILTSIENSVFNPNFHKTAELIQINLFDIGIKSEIISLLPAALEKRLASGHYDTYLTGINMPMNDPDSLFRPLLSCDATVAEGNSSQWCSKRVQTLLDSALLESNFIKRIMSYYKLQEITQQDRPYYPIAHVLRVDASNQNISGLRVNPLTGIDFQYIRKTEVN
jgi:cationic peptide transport system substrate-binding protein